MTTTTALAIRPALACPVCGILPSIVTYDQLALFSHAGYGATKRVVLKVCGCQARLVAEFSRNPRYLASALLANAIRREQTVLEAKIRHIMLDTGN